MPIAPDPRETASPPRLALPALACDCHYHVFGPAREFPYAQERSYTPPDCLFEQRLALHERLGIARSVIVQPSVYGTDNRAMLAAMARSRPGAVRGVAVIGPATSEAELDAMHAQGVRGVRVNALFKGGTPIAEVRRLAERVAPRGWHVQFLIDVSAFPDPGQFLGSLPVPVVVDHMGHFPAARGVADAGFVALLRLVATGRCWVKLSAPYRLSAQPFPHRDVAPIARALVEANPERLVWGSDWPHPGIAAPMPDDGKLVDLIGEWVPDARVRDRIVRDNPAMLYGFAGA